MSTKNKQQNPGIKTMLRMLVVSSRPVSWINTAFPFAAGYIATGGSINGSFVIASLYFLIPYNILVYVVNDVFDYESDLRNPRKGGIEGGLIPPRAHRFMLLATALVNLPFLIYLFFVGSMAANLALLAIIFGALAYSVPRLRFKEIPILDSMTSSFHFASPLLFGLILTGWQTSYLPYLLAFYLWGMASHAFGAVQDIIPDQQAGIHSIATKFGAAATVRLSFVLYLLSSLMLIFQANLAVFAGITEWLYLYMLVPYLSVTNTNSQQTNKGWKKFIKLNQFSGFVVTMLLIIHTAS